MNGGRGASKERDGVLSEITTTRQKISEVLSAANETALAVSRLLVGPAQNPPPLTPDKSGPESEKLSVGILHTIRNELQVILKDVSVLASTLDELNSRL